MCLSRCRHVLPWFSHSSKPDGSLPHPGHDRPAIMSFDAAALRKAQDKTRVREGGNEAREKPVVLFCGGKPGVTFESNRYTSLVFSCVCSFACSPCLWSKSLRHGAFGCDVVESKHLAHVLFVRLRPCLVCLLSVLETASDRAFHLLAAQLLRPPDGGLRVVHVQSVRLHQGRGGAEREGAGALCAGSVSVSRISI